MSGKDFMPFEEPPKKKVERQPSWESVKQNPAMQEDPRMRPQPPIRYTEAMKKRWGPPSAESLEVEEARRKDPSLKVSFSFDPKTGMVGLKRTDPAQAAAAQPTAGMIGQQPKSQPEGATLEQDPKGSVPTVAPNQIAQTPQPTPSSQPSRVNHDRKPDPVPFIESNIPIIGRHQLWGTKGTDYITIVPSSSKPGMYEVTVTYETGKFTDKRLLTEEQLRRTDIHGGTGDDWFDTRGGKLPPGTKFYGDSGDDTIIRSRENRNVEFDGGKGNDTTFTEISRTQKPNGKDKISYDVQSDIQAGSPEGAVHGFIRAVAENAENRLANNSARLKSEQKGLEDLSPTNRKWTQLRELAQKDQELVAYKNRLTDQISALQIKDQPSSLSSTPPFLSPDTVSERPNTLPGLKNAYPIGVINPQTQAKIEELKAQQNLITLVQRQRQAQYPALAVLDTAVVAKTANTPEGNQALLKTIGKGFGKIQGSIAELQDQILEDPERAMVLDDVRNSMLKKRLNAVNAKRPEEQVDASAIKDYLRNRELQKLGGDILTGGLTVGAVIGTILAPEAMWPLWVGAAGTAAGVTTGIRDYREFSTVDLAAQAQQGGAGSLTSKSKEEARFDLIMGQTNLLMAGLDVGMTAKGTVGLIKGSTKMGASLSKVKPAVLSQAIKDVAAGQVEKARAGLEAAGKFSKNEVDETLRWMQNLDSGNVRLAADGMPGGALDEVKPTQANQMKGTGGGKGKEPLKPQTSASKTPILPEFKDITLGKPLGSGGNKVAYEVPGRQDIAIAVLEKGKSPGSIDREIGFLNELREQGLPTVEVLGKTTHNGQPAMIMKRYAQGSKDVVKLDRNNKVRIVGESKFLNEKSISDLNKIRSILKSKKIKIDDLQFLINKDGSIVVADPLDVHVNVETSKNNMRMIDLLIDSAQKNLN
jgi:hypothetical protein